VAMMRRTHAMHERVLREKVDASLFTCMDLGDVSVASVTPLNCGLSEAVQCTQVVSHVVQV
jgi:hypothetical protein